MFTSLKDMRSKSSDLSSLLKTVDDMEKKGFEKQDEGSFWTPPADKSGNGFAIIRFLPAPKGEDVAFTRRYDHGFQGPSGKWYIENSLTTLGQPDPVSEANSELWNSVSDDNTPERDLVRKRKRRLNYYSNILVVKDPARPENEGKVFLFKYGAKIFAKIRNALKPPVEGMPKFNPFDFWEGANLQLIVCKEKNYRNYDQSKFEGLSQIAKTDEEIMAIWEQCKSLQEFVDPKNFKSYEELKRRFEYVTNAPQSLTSAPSAKAPEPKSESAKSPLKAVASKPVEEPEEDMEDTEAYFKSLATSN